MNRLHPATSIIGVKCLFSERIPKKESKKSDELLPGFECIDGIVYVNRVIDTSNSDKLRELFDRMYSQYKEYIKESSFSLFIESEIESAQNYQSYFPKYKSNPSDNLNYFALQRWIEYLEQRKSEGLDKPQQPGGKATNKRPAAKYYALYHWILIEMGAESDFERNENDQYIRSEIETFAKDRYSQTDSQGFYRAFREIDITDRTAIANGFGKGYKEKLAEISHNNANVIVHLRDYPN